MAFQQTTATNRADLIAKFASFAIANAGFSSGVGFTDTVSTSNYCSGETVTELTKAGHSFFLGNSNNNLFNGYVHSGADPDHAGIMLAHNVTTDARTSMKNFDVVTGTYRVSFCSTYGTDGPYSNVYFFTDGNVVACCFNITGDIYTHFSIGSISKYSTWVGGEFVSGFNAGDHAWTSNTLYADINNQTSKTSLMFLGGILAPASFNMNSLHFTDSIRFVRTIGSTGGYNDYSLFGSVATGNNNSAAGMLNSYYMRAPHYTGNNQLNFGSNKVSKRTPMLNCDIYLGNRTSNRWFLAGDVPIIKFCYNDFIQPGEIILDDWQVFPLSQKNGDRTLAMNSRNLAIAYKRA